MTAAQQRDEALHALLEECGRQRCELAMALADATSENDKMRQCAQVLAIVGPQLLDGTADAEDKELFRGALAGLLELGGRRA